MADLQFQHDYDGRIICPYNSECRCTSTNCAPCGWNPKVYNRRVKELAKKFKTPADELAMLLHKEDK